MDDHVYSGKISASHTENESMSVEQRLSNIEHDVTAMARTLHIVATRYDDQSDWIAEKIIQERQHKEFWIDVRKRLVSGGIFAFIGAVFTALVYAATQWIETH